MTSRSLSTLASSAVLLALAACADPRPAQEGGGAAMLCVHCHGGVDNQTGAPPKDVKGQVATTSRGVGAHTAHVQAGPVADAFGCVQCHPDVDELTSPQHLNGQVNLAWGPLASASGATPSFSATTSTCSSVYCHGATLTGGTNTQPSWTTVNGSQAACGTCHGLPPTAHPALAAGSTTATCFACHPGTVTTAGVIDVAGGKHVNGLPDGFAGHPAGWMDRTSPDYHGWAAAQGADGCLACHAAKAPATVSAITCATCHDALAGGNDWTTTCYGCHGTPTSAAPPPDVFGDTATTAIGVGAHQSHLQSNLIARPFDCTACHVLPANVFDPGHLDGQISVTAYTGSDPALQAAVQNPGWSATARTCATSYCHGATLSGGSVPQPEWTKVDGTQGACGSCHGLPPTQHPLLAAGSTAATCSVCHPDTVRPDGTIDVTGGRHLNGLPNGFAGHSADWMNKASPEYHGYVAALGATPCLSCHAAKAPAVVSAITCASCHDALVGGADWTVTCYGCHGSPDSAAPPKDVLGNTETTAVGVGAHQKHVRTGTMAAYDCSYCHEKPADVFALTHLNGQILVTGYTGTDPVALAAIGNPTWERTAQTCATAYCHGNYSGTFTYFFPGGDGTLQEKTVAYAGTPAQPAWTSGSAPCGSCHAVPPQNGIWHTNHIGGCNLCHEDALGIAGSTTDPPRINPASNCGGTSPNTGTQPCRAFHANGAIDDDTGRKWTVLCYDCH